jgi:hypothetical protein
MIANAGSVIGSVGAGHGRSGGEGDEAHGRTDIRDIADFSMQIAWWISRIRVGTAPKLRIRKSRPISVIRKSRPIWASQGCWFDQN